MIVNVRTDLTDHFSRYRVNCSPMMECKRQTQTVVLHANASRLSVAVVIAKWFTQLQHRFGSFAKVVVVDPHFRQGIGWLAFCPQPSGAWMIASPWKVHAGNLWFRLEQAGMLQDVGMIA
jgi:hypothetical protein